MSDYTITLPDGTVVEGENYTEVHRLATAARMDMYLRKDGAYYEYEETYFNDDVTLTDVVEDTMQESRERPAAGEE